MFARNIVLSLFAATALASPLQKRAVVVDHVQYTTVVYQTVTEGSYGNPSYGSPTPAPYQAPHHKHHHHHHHHHHASPASTQPSYSSPASSAAPASSPASGGSGGGLPSGKGYQAEVVRNHNVHRSNHTASNIQWDEDLYNTAMKIAQSCVYAHNTEEDGGGYGQNIAAGVTGANIATVITDLFYNGEINAFGDQYGNPNPSGFEEWGHFSQVVWANTQKVGCATYDCSSQGLANTGGDVPPYFTVCNYSPAGNVEGEYGTQIHKPLGHPSVGGNY